MIKRVFRFWIGFGESPIFSKKDHTMFYVVPADGNREMRLDREGFVESESVDEIRDLLVAEIDKWYDHAVHMRKLNEFSADMDKKKKIEAVDDSKITSLSIGAISDKRDSGFVGNSGLTDLLDIN